MYRLFLGCLLLVGCGDDDGGVRPMPDAGPPAGDSGPPDAGPPPPFAPRSYCPGSPGCLDEGDMVLHAGAAAVEITPTVDAMTEIQTVDVNGNGEYDPADGDEFRDTNGNGLFEGIWMAGYGAPRGASAVNDPQWARAIALRYNQTTIVLATVDLVGWFISEMDMVREEVSDLDVDYVMLASTHNHQGRDVIGIWGPNEFEAGFNAEYNAFVRTQTAEAIRMAVAALRPAHVQYADFDLRDAPGGVMRYTSDARHPVILDDEVRVMRFVDAMDETMTITTLVNWSAHPEYGGDRNQLLSSDYPHWLREGIEDGVMQPDGTMVPGVGGITVFFQGALGSQIGPYGGWQRRIWDMDGTIVPELDLRHSEFVGKSIATLVLQALAAGGGTTMDETAALGFRNHRFYVKVQNTGFHVAILGNIFTPRPTFDWDPEMPLIANRNEPSLETEVAVIDIGRAQILTGPGELDPALFVGGYDGSYTPMGVEIINASEENPPDLSRAPPAPYLRDLMRSDAEQRYFFGLADDFLGYFIPEFDYVLHPSNPYIDEAAGEHYEETNSVGEDGWPTIETNIRALLAWEPGAP